MWEFEAESPRIIRHSASLLAQSPSVLVLNQPQQTHSILMKTKTTKLGITLAGVLALIVTSAHADTFGSGGNAFTIDFVTIGDPGNANDSGTTGSYFTP